MAAPLPPTLSTAELPQHERGASVVPTVASLGTGLARLANRALHIVVALAARTDLDATALIGVAGGVQKVRDGLDQICAACAPPRVSVEDLGVHGSGAQRGGQPNEEVAEHQGEADRVHAPTVALSSAGGESGR
ncbi:MAG: hypothetical protein EPO40_19670 [Myxococcaceae bacterium]|nr:MAG: hypothetical protein EPO40_19670 [Myxococcaceae bacterium]